MRRSAVLVIVALGAFAIGCSRREPPAPSSKESQHATTLAAVLPTESATPAPSVLASATLAPPPTSARSLTGKKILHIGDSMVGGTFGLTRALEARLKREGATLVRHTQVSESLSSFDKSPTLRDQLRTHHPDIVIINLGTNDTLSPYPGVYARSIENIARRAAADGRECWWIGPPTWKGADTGLVAVIRENAGACHFFDSTKLELERAGDGLHPNDRGAAKWAEAFWPTFVDPS